MRTCFALALGMCVFATASTSSAQTLPQGIDSQLLHPSPFRSAVLGLDAAEEPGLGGLTTGLFTTYLRKPVEAPGTAVAGRPSAVVHDVVGLELQGAIRTQKLELGVAVPFTTYQDGHRDDGTGQTALNRFAMSDLRFGIRINAHQYRALNIAVLAMITAGTGKDRQFAGAGTLVTEPRFLVGLRDHRGGVAVSAGIRVRESARLAGDINLGTAGVAHMSGHYRVASGLDVVAGVSGIVGGSERESPAEAIAGVRYRKPRWELMLGAGRRVTDGVGASRARVFLGARYLIDRAPRPPSGNLAAPRTR